MAKNASLTEKWPSSGILIFAALMYSSGGYPYHGTAASASGTLTAASSVSAPPIQKPDTPAFALSCFRYWTAPRISWAAASPKSRLLIKCWASWASTVTSPRYRSGTRARYPAVASRVRYTFYLVVQPPPFLNNNDSRGLWPRCGFGVIPADGLSVRSLRSDCFHNRNHIHFNGENRGLLRRFSGEFSGDKNENKTGFREEILFVGALDSCSCHSGDRNDCDSQPHSIQAKCQRKLGRCQPPHDK